MTDSNLPPLRWEPVPGCSSYRASTHGEVRSVDRDLPDGRHRTGQRISTRVNNSGYPLINLTNDQGERITRTLHTVILTTFDGECPPGQTARHLDDNPLHNTWAPGATAEERMAAGGNLMWGTWPEQVADGVRNGGRKPAEPRPLKHCIICGDVFGTPGRRCHDCLDTIGREAAALLAAGTPLERVCDVLRYPSAEGLLKLAARHADSARAESASPLLRRAAGHAAPPPPRPPWLRRVVATLRDRLRQAH
jgi:NUMOD4 motif